MSEFFDESIISTSFNAEEIDNLKKQIFRLNDLFMKYLEKKTRSFLFVNYDRKEQALSILRILVKAHIEHLIKMDDIQDGEGVVEAIRKLGGLIELREWLEKQKNAKEILQESGTEKTFQSLWQLKFDYFSKSYFIESGYLSKTKELCAWIRMVAFFLDRDTSRDKRNFMFAWAYEKAWNLTKIMSFFIITLTLEIDRKELLKEDLFDFLKKFKDFESWKKDLENKIQKIQGENKDWIWTVYQGEQSQKLITGWCKFPAQIILDAEKLFPLAKESKKVLSDLKIYFENATVYQKAAVQRRKGQKKDREDPLLYAKKKVQEILNNFGIKFLYNFFLERKYLLDWLTSEQIAKILIYDISNNGSMREEILNLGLSSAVLLEKLEKKMTLSEFIFYLISEPKPFDIEFNSILKDRSNFKKEKTENAIVDFEKEILFKISLCISDLDFGNLISSIKKELNPKVIPLRIALSLFLTKKKTLEIIELSLSDKGWFYLIKDPIVKTYFKEYFHYKSSELTNENSGDIMKI